jgi:hypothetical protein
VRTEIHGSSAGKMFTYTNQIFAQINGRRLVYECAQRGDICPVLESGKTYTGDQNGSTTRKPRLTLVSDGYPLRRLLLDSRKKVAGHGNSPSGWICPSHRESRLPLLIFYRAEPAFRKSLTLLRSPVTAPFQQRCATRRAQGCVTIPALCRRGSSGFHRLEKPLCSKF